MRTSERQNVDQAANPVNETTQARYASQVGKPLTQAQANFMYLIECQGFSELSKSLKMVHDLALYHTDIPFDHAEKSALFDVKLLWEGFDEMANA